MAGVAAGQTIYVLRSDGTLFEIVNYRSKNFKLYSWVTGIPATNNEGLCYDAKNNRLLIACKGKIGKGPEFKDKRVIYGFDLVTKKLTSEPVYDLSLAEIQQYAATHNIKLPNRTKKNKSSIGLCEIVPGNFFIIINARKNTQYKNCQDQW